MSDKTIFKRIIDGEIPVERLHDDEHCLAFRDIAPQAPVHVLVIPKREIRNIAAMTDDDRLVVGHLFAVVRDLAVRLGLSEGYRVVTNTGPQGGQSVDHLHLHLLGGRPMLWPPG
ncbi:MAG TPA: histidine triad nucleotide-binding protein [Planctomycetaceae bacterium]|nr:histidine triad nucleotide-binding protein [Planctomycetaceae bacterium]HRF01856.1 histidine triad nucleotide-binding protein [Pirellulaceae bacterium]